MFETYYANETEIPFYAIKELLTDCETDFRSSSWLTIKCIENDKNILNYCKSQLTKENYAALNSLVSNIRRGNLHTGNCKFAMIHDLLKSAVNSSGLKPTLSKFDRIATSRIWGKPLAIGIILLAFISCMVRPLCCYMGSYANTGTNILRRQRHTCFNRYFTLHVYYDGNYRKSIR